MLADDGVGADHSYFFKRLRVVLQLELIDADFTGEDDEHAVSNISLLHQRLLGKELLAIYPLADRYEQLSLVFSEEWHSEHQVAYEVVTLHVRPLVSRLLDDVEEADEAFLLAL